MRPRGFCLREEPQAGTSPGCEEALAWRLLDIRPGVNEEVRYSFEAGKGVHRPAFEVIRRHQALECSAKNGID